MTTFNAHNIINIIAILLVIIIAMITAYITTLRPQLQCTIAPNTIPDHLTINATGMNDKVQECRKAFDNIQDNYNEAHAPNYIILAGTPTATCNTTTCICT